MSEAITMTLATMRSPIEYCIVPAIGKVGASVADSVPPVTGSCESSDDVVPTLSVGSAEGLAVWVVMESKSLGVVVGDDKSTMLGRGVMVGISVLKKPVVGVGEMAVTVASSARVVVVLTAC